MCDYFNMVCGFNSLVYFSVAQIAGEVSIDHCVVFTKVLVFLSSYYRFLVLARIDLSVGQDAYISWPACMFSWTVNVFSWLE